MGGRGSFLNVDLGNFAFKEGGQTFFTIGEIDGVKILERPGKSVKAPEISHTENAIYAIIQNGELKHLAFYDENHNQKKCIDFSHFHGINHVKPHVHFNLQHINNEPGFLPTIDDMLIAQKINDWINDYYKKGDKNGK